MSLISKRNKMINVAISQFVRLVSVVLLMSVVPFSSAYSADKDSASKYVESVGNQAIDILSDKNLDKKDKEKHIEELFRKNVDIKWIGRFVIGRFWRQLEKDKKESYMQAYEKFVIKNYASKFVDYSSGSFKISGSHDNGDNEFTINMEIKADDNSDEPIIVDYKVRNEGKKFLIFDIIIENVSMIATQRSEFNSVMANKGIDYLTEQLVKKSNIDTD
ncbi:MAG: ABC transporter substrate-binding protein [Rickettsiales bacterium]